MFSYLPNSLNVFVSDQPQSGFWSLSELTNFKNEFFGDNGLLYGSGIKINIFLICGENSNVQRAQKDFEKIF